VLHREVLAVEHLVVEAGAIFWWVKRRVSAAPPTSSGVSTPTAARSPAVTTICCALFNSRPERPMTLSELFYAGEAHVSPRAPSPPAGNRLGSAAGDRAPAAA
jgi:hypothetical protein